MPVVRAQLVAHRLPICAVASEVCVAIRKWLPETAVAADLLGPARQRLPETAAATEHAVAVVTVGSCCDRADWRPSADDGDWAGRMITSNSGALCRSGWIGSMTNELPSKIVPACRLLEVCLSFALLPAAERPDRY